MSAPEFIRIADAAARVGLKPSALRAEARRGRLAVYRVANKDWTTEEAVREMFERCRVRESLPGSISVVPASEPATDTVPFGSSSTEEAKLALAAALSTARALKRGLPITSPKNVKSPGENVISAKFRSPT